MDLDQNACEKKWIRMRIQKSEQKGHLDPNSKEGFKCIYFEKCGSGSEITLPLKADTEEDPGLRIVG